MILFLQAYILSAPGCCHLVASHLRHFSMSLYETHKNLDIARVPDWLLGLIRSVARGAFHIIRILILTWRQDA